MAANRVRRLKDVVGLLERLPASPDRDRILSEVRSRAVDVDTGVAPRAMLPLREPTPALVGPSLSTRNRASSITPTAPALPAPAVELAGSASAAGVRKTWSRRSGRMSGCRSRTRRCLTLGRRATEPFLRGRSVCARSLGRSRNAGRAAL
jgi:hypothetical protein